MCVLSGETIKASMVTPNKLITGNYCERQVRTASYDLRMGYEFYLSDGSDKASSRISAEFLGLRDWTLEIPCNGVVVVRTAETISMPNGMVGHLGLKLDILLKGIIMSSQSQIDAGYKGAIFCLLYNLSDVPVTISALDPILRLEFATIDSEMRSYDGHYQGSTRVSQVVKKRIGSSLGSMNARIESAEQGVAQARRFELWSAVGAVLAVVVITATLAIPILTDASHANSNVSSESRQVAALSAQVQAQQAEITQLQRGGTTQTATSSSTQGGSSQPTTTLRAP